MVRRRFNKSSIADVPADKPILYDLKTGTGRSNYVGVAKRGRVRQRLGDHLPGGSDPIPAKTVEIKQFSSISDARAAEKRAIKTKQPKYNRHHK